MKPRIVMQVARTLALLWAGFWMFFFIAESLAWDTPVYRMLAWVGVGLLFVLLAIVPWRWEVAGGELLAVAGLAAAVAYWIWAPADLPSYSRLLTTIVFGVPPIVAGILFLIHHRTPRSSYIGH